MSGFWDDPLHDERSEQRHARDHADAGTDDDRPTEAELRGDERRGPDLYTGICGGCGSRVTADAREPGGEDGSCLWRGGPWHPGCRTADKARGGTRRLRPVQAKEEAA